jgi:4-amino-4-deoxy-L-arabinose transferase-like glycosyltransferase
VALALAGLVVRLGLIVATPDYEPDFDAFDYDRHASSIEAGDGYPRPVITLDESSPTAFRPPLYPHLLAAVYKVSPGSLTPGRMFGAALGALSVLLICLIAQEFWGRRAAIAAGALAALFPPLVVLSASLTVESLFIPFELGLVLVLLAYGRSGARLGWVALAGALVGLAALTRGNGFLLMIPVFLALIALRPAGAPGRHALRGTLVAAGVAVLVISPWTIRNTIAFDRVIPLTDSFGYALRGTYSDVARSDDEAKGAWRPPDQDPANRSIYLNPENNEADIDSRLLDAGIEYIKDNPGYAIEAPLLNTYRLANPLASDEQRRLSYIEMGIPESIRWLVTASWYVVALLALVGVVALVRRRFRPGPLWMWAIPLLMGGSTVVLSGAPRYRATLDPFIVMLAGLGVLILLELGRARYRAPASGSAQPG